MKKLKKWFRGLSYTGKIATVAIVALISIGTISTAAQQGTTPAPVAVPITSTPTPKVAEPKVEIKSVNTTEAIQFTSSTIDDSGLAQGTTQTRTAGVAGIMTHTSQVTYKDGVETSRSASIDTVTTPAINEVIVHGTKVPAPVCENGTYVNTYGNTVCRPYSSPSAPAGASAQCSDGSYSFSQSRSGTCSHHGGVSTWL